MISDEALCERWLAGDLRAFDALYARYSRPLFGFIRKELCAVHEAEDVLHETFMAVLKDGRRRRDTSSFRAWLFQIARHLCLNRERTRHRASHAAEVTARVPEENVAAPADVLEQKQSLHVLGAAVGKLPKELAALFTLRSQGMSYEEMADVLELPVGTVKSRMNQMLNLLRAEVRP